ncbi:hypothetical protein IVB22_33645 [Bradyrhizobium sp. 190]|uniref:hypothetical protein n=1 Tax=Bradyrhizobium sp. 190 TaxID=2782658 RepID=UPI001FF72866|nr:hypothetical protein [Bradyrhizobium sp. 190]MCK1517363.1 hypothetical protein [Bradyrhizobium sp. 190]
MAALGAPIVSAASAQGPAPAAFRVISPIFGQLVTFSMPANFVVVSDNSTGPNYIREAVLKLILSFVRRFGLAQPIVETVAQRIQRVTLALAQAMIFNELVDRSGERIAIVAVAILVWVVDNKSRNNLWYVKTLSANLK